jgi:ABC-type branched-subunit amino acid transport system substrate-binding protein
LFCTGPTPAQQCDLLIPYIVKTLGRKRFAMPAANFVAPQVRNKYARKLIEENGGEVVFEEYYPLDQAEYSATIGKIRNRKVDCVFNSTVPPGLQPFAKQLYESGFQKNGGLVAAVNFDELTLNFLPAAEMEGLLSCLDYFLAVFLQQAAPDWLRQEIPRHEVPVYGGQRLDRHVSRHKIL